MLNRLHAQLTFFCTLATGLILVALTFVCLLISESSLRRQDRASFESDVLSLYQQLENSSTLTHQWLLQTSDNYGISLRLRDQGVPLFFQQLSGQEDYDGLFGAAETAAISEYGLDLLDGCGLQSITLHREFSVKDENGKDAWAAAALIPKSSGFLSVLVLQPLAALSRQLRSQRAFFALADLAGLLLLFLFSWYFTAKMLVPIRESRRKQTQFIAAASHELRSPLTVMLSCLSAARDAAPPDEAKKVPGGSPLSRSWQDWLSVAEAEGLRMSRLIGDMLTLANADNQSWEIRPLAVELDTLLLQTWETFESSARSRGFSWEIQLPEDPLPCCFCDAERIVQVLEILIDNAFSYTPSGGSIRLSLDYAASGRLPFALRVSDNGPGIPDDQKKAVFERFQRLDTSRRDKSHFGLGLSIAEEIVCAHGGSLAVEDTPGGGATFVILLPGKKALN